MSLLQAVEIKVGMTIQFQSNNPYDNNIYSGLVISLCDYEIARIYSDIVRYNEEVQGELPDTPDIKLLNYFIVRNNTGNAPTAFALEWIKANTLKVIVVPRTSTLEIYNASDNQLKEAVKLLTNAGMSVKIVEIDD